MEKNEGWFLVILIGVGIYGFVYSLRLPLMGPAALSPGIFPGFVTALIVVLGGVQLRLYIRSKVAVLKNFNREVDGETGKEDSGVRNIFVIVALFLGYLLLLNFIHFLASTFLFLFAAMFFLYKRLYWKIPVISIITAVGIFYLFRYMLNVRLP